MKKIDVKISIEVPRNLDPEQTTTSDIYFVGWFVGSSFWFNIRCYDYHEAVDIAADYSIRYNCKCSVYRLTSKMVVLC